MTNSTLKHDNTACYRHRYSDGSAIDFPLGKVVCVGRNYAAHARELNNPIPATPLLFIKPATALVPLEMPLAIPRDQGTVHHELELALLIGKQLDKHSGERASDAIAGVGLALDLTLRDVQSKLKNQGHPWEIAKGFDGACPCSSFINASAFGDLQSIEFRLRVNGELRQEGNSRDMLFPIAGLLQEMARHFTLQPGDIVLTGTPQGVSELRGGDSLEMSLQNLLRLDTQVAG